MRSFLSDGWDLSVFGESHGAAIGFTLGSLPAGMKIDLDELARFMARRAPGQSTLTTQRREKDGLEFLSGLKNGVLTGAPLTAIIRNSGASSRDYDALRDIPRPGHADMTARARFHGWEDMRGGGHFSGRLTAPLTAAGGIAMQILRGYGISVGAHISELSGVRDTPFDPIAISDAVFASRVFSPLTVLDPEKGREMERAIEKARGEGDSVGGVIECAAVGVPAGLGDPMFFGIENRVSRLIFAIPGVRGIEFGAGFAASRMTGSSHNDPFILKDGKVACKTNSAGGILGGITNGMPVLFRAAFKPTPSITKEQRSVELSKMRETVLSVPGRHDPCIAVRAVPVVEAVCALALFSAVTDAEKEGIL